MCVSIAIWCFWVTWMGVTVIVGHFTNRKMAMCDFYNILIHNRENDIADQAQKAEAKRINDEKFNALV